MSENLFKKRKLEFIKIILEEKRLPKVWEFRFTDGEDMRIWFNGISKLERFNDFVNEVNNILSKYNLKVLSDKEKEEEFLNYIGTHKKTPMRNEIYFSDNIDMYTWYMNYIIKNKDFETIVHNSLPEYQELDLAEIWTSIKDEFINILKVLKRVPNHRETILKNGIDVRSIYDKLETYDPVFFEKLLLHLQTYNKKGLSIDDRIKELKETVSTLGYIPLLQESRFSDRTDMFTWYMKYKNRLPNLETELNSLISKSLPKNKVNIYFIPNFRSNRGKFYTICTNIGERLDLSNIDSFEEAKEIDNNIVKRANLVLKKDEEIDSVTILKGKTR